MPTAWPMIHDASLVSEAAARRTAGRALVPWRVHSIYRAVLNITSPDGLLTLASPEVGELPNGILVGLGSDWRMLGIQAGMVAHASAAVVRVPGVGLEVRLEAAPRWSPRFQLQDIPVDARAERWRRRSIRTRAIVRLRATSMGGFGPLLRHDRADQALPSITAAAGPATAALGAALEAGDRGAAARAAIGLVGLGPGLTPSGDDLLVGIEAALHGLDSPMAGFLASALDGVEARTTALAATLLRHAAQGEFAGRLHTVVGVFVGTDDDAIAAAVARACAWGATSGMDCLVGVLLGLDAAAGVRGPLT